MHTFLAAMATVLISLGQAEPESTRPAEAPDEATVHFENAKAFREWSNEPELELSAEKLTQGMAVMCEGQYEALAEAERLGVAAFFGGAFSQDPSLIDPVVDRFIPGGSANEIELALYSLWLAETEAADAKLAAIRDAKGQPEVRMFAARLLESASPIAPEEQITTGLQLDLLWGRYLGSRSEAPVERVISVFEELGEESEEGMGVAIARRAAVRSLFVMASRHEDVLAVCREQVDEVKTEPARRALREIIAEVELRESPERKPM